MLIVKVLRAARKKGIAIDASGNLERARKVIAQFDKMDERRLEIPKDPNLPRIHIDPRRPVIVIVCSRYSGSEPEGKEAEKARIKTVLKTGRVVRGLEGATYEDICMINTKLTRALPIQTGALRKGYARHKLASILQNAKNGTQIVFVSLGLDGISSNRSGWEDLIEFQHSKGLKINLLIAEDSSQWYKTELLWSNHDWRDRSRADSGHAVTWKSCWILRAMCVYIPKFSSSGGSVAMEGRQESEESKKRGGPYQGETGRGRRGSSK